MASLHPRVRMILTADTEMGRWQSHNQELPGRALYWKMWADRLLRLRRRRAHATETPPDTRLRRRRSGESARTNPALRQKTHSALWRGDSPDSRCLAARRMLPPTLWSALSRRLDALCTSKLEMRGGRFAVMNQAN